MVQYDEKIIQSYVEAMYRRARSVTSSHFFIGLLAGLIAFAHISTILVGELDLLIVAIGVLTGAFLGIGSGRAKAFQLQIQAQMALCQVKMEQNTRKA